MALLKIITYPDKFLTRVVKPVENIDGAFQELVDDMIQTMYQAPGIGLAAIQVGVDQSIIVYDISPRKPGESLNVLINAKIISGEGSVTSENEGCLSVPDFTTDVKRFEKVQVEGVDRHGKPVCLEADGLMAIMLQHEIDHLNGKLFIDRISQLKRELYKRRRLKQLKNDL
jgi:peptide deformylase